MRYKFVVLLLIFAGFFADFADAVCQAEQASFTCNNGNCIISGGDRITLGSQHINTLTILQPNECGGIAITIAEGATVTIDTVIIAASITDKTSDGIGVGFFPYSIYGNSSLTITNIKAGTTKNPMGVWIYNDRHFALINQEYTDNIKVKVNGQIIQKPGTGSSNGGSAELPPDLTPEQTINALFNYAQALNEQLRVESANAMILYNILNNYDGTYINYDYGFGNQVGIGAFNNGIFARYYNKDSANGFDVGAKYKIQVANKLYIRGAAYYSNFLSTHSIIAGIGLLKDIDFALGSSGKVFFVLNPSLNIYYAATLKGKYMPTNHLGFFNAGLETGLRIKKTSLLVRGSAGGAINSLKNIRADLGNGAIYKNKTYFNNALYSASFVLNQGIGKFYLQGEVGAVFLDKPYLKAGAMLGYEFGKKDTRETRKSARYQKAQKKTNIRKTLSNPPANAAKSNARANSQKPNNNNTKSTKTSNTNNAKSNANNATDKTPAQRGLLRKKVNLPKVPASTKSNNATPNNAKPSDTKSNNTSANNTRARQNIRAVNNSKAK